jgi:hypothetical protein
MSLAECIDHLETATERYSWDINVFHETNAWIVLVDGKRVRLSSGKSLWNKRGHAKSALRNQLGNFSPFHPGDKAIDWHRHQREAEDCWMEDHAEFITLAEWIERGCP